MNAILLANVQLDVVGLTIGLLGGLALFLYGMHEMSDGLKGAAGDGMKTLLAKLTSNRFLAAMTGALVTAVIQSSSVTTVLVVGFVSAGLMSLQQSVGVIMGANVGTTVTAQIVAFNVTEFAWVLIVAGFAISSLSRRDQFRHYGAMLMGLGLLFLGLDKMSDATGVLRSYEPFIQVMRNMDHPLLGILFGAVFAALVQSSSATTGVVIMLASQGFLSLEAGIALAIGANIGTCVTAALASIGKTPEAIRAAAVHVIFNLLGAVLWVGFIEELAEITRLISPVAANLEGVEKLASETPRQVANANTIFNVANTCVLIWFAGAIAWITMRLIPGKPAAEPERVEPKYLDPVYLQTPSLALDRVLLELDHLGQRVTRMLKDGPPAAVEGSGEDLQKVEDMDNGVDQLYFAIIDYLRAIGREELTSSESNRLDRLLATANYLESTGDLIETNLVAQGRRRLRDGVTFSPQTMNAIRPLYEDVVEAMQKAVQAASTGNEQLANEVITSKDRIHGLADSVTEHLSQRLMSDEPNRASLFSIESDIVGQLKRLFYNARRIAKLVPE